MRKVVNINKKWLFTMNSESKTVSLPHTWNNLDGQDGTNGYLKGKAVYSKTLEPSDKITFLECEGVNAKAEIRVDNQLIYTHKGGYSTFRVDITKFIKYGCRLDITADNSADDTIYPAFADFTFYGGIYRDVNLIEVPECRFSMTDHGSDGVYVTPVKKDDKWEVQIKALIDNADYSHKLRFTLLDADEKVAAQKEVDIKPIVCDKLIIENPILWQGVENPYLYTVKCELIDSNGNIDDNLDIKTGFREFYIDSEKGFFLNGKHIKLKGVSRHQDREDMGNAITPKQHREDVKLILDIGANSVRLAHYQQNKFFYNLCDEKGLLVWAEVPVISKFNIKAQANAQSQLVELIKQNYNHPAIFCWGIENELTLSGNGSKQMISCIDKLNRIAKHLDHSRLTTCAQVSFCNIESQLNNITDILGYNHYFGWYAGTSDEISNWLDDWHEKNPLKKLCLSEYGAEGIINYHSENPVQGDYSEDYQAMFHEKYLENINSRDWLWGSYVWNMFDFGSAMRNEGGIRGRNNKGLVTFDRDVKKDAFYLYKAYWSDKRFVHITKERYVERPIGKTDIKVYSNCPKVTLSVNGKSQIIEGNKIFIFKDIEIKEGENVITACGARKRPVHTIKVIGTNEPSKSYTMPGDCSGFIRNWFTAQDSDKNPDMLSIEDNIGTLVSSCEFHSLIKNSGGDSAEKIVSSPLLKPLYPVKVKTLVKVAEKLGTDEKMLNMFAGFLQTVKK